MVEDSRDEMITLRVNGTRHDLRLEPRVSLLDTLREGLGLTGTKKGCCQGAIGVALTKRPSSTNGTGAS